MIFAYNKKHIGDTLIVIVANDQEEKNTVEIKGKIARITAGATVIGWNFFDVSAIIAIEGAGQVYLTDEQLAVLNEHLAQAGFSERLEADLAPKIVVGYVESCEPHPDSDHLSITKTRVSADEVLQIVCGAPNIAAGQKVVVAKVGAMMPDGTLIWAGNLRGVDSYGMICSARELHLPNAPEKRGILELSADAVVGEAFLVGK